jgi:regulator of sirC expression with transglutaminase-like and TPR domain
MKLLQKLKDEGNEHVQTGDYHGAIARYEAALTCTGVSKDTEALRLSLPSNLSLCHLKVSQWELCISSAAQVIEAGTVNFKALFRRGVAYLNAGDASLAVKDLRAAQRLSPTDQSIATELIKAEEARLEC